MTVKELRLMLDECADSALVVVSSSDHSYREADADYTDGTIYKGNLSEFHGDDYMEKGEKKIKVLVIN